MGSYPSQASDVIVHAGAFGEPEIHVGEIGRSSNLPIQALASLGERNSGFASAMDHIATI